MDRLGWTATASKSSSNATEMTGMALDGKLETRWTSGAGQAPGMWFQLDMGYPRSFDRVVFDATGSGSDFPQSYKLYVSNDPAVPGTAVAQGTGQAVTTITLDAPKGGQFIRLECAASTGSFFSIHEVNVRCADGGIGIAPHNPNAGTWFSIEAASRNAVYRIPVRGQVTIEEMSLNGETRRVLWDGVQEAGIHRLALKSDAQGAKVALFKVTYNGKSQLHKATFLD
jgi:hypothetical protein